MKNLVLNECSILAHTLRSVSVFLSLSVCGSLAHAIDDGEKTPEGERKEICVCVCVWGRLCCESACSGGGGWGTCCNGRYERKKRREGGREGGRRERRGRQQRLPFGFFVCSGFFPFPGPGENVLSPGSLFPRRRRADCFSFFLPDLPDLPSVVVFFFSSFSPSFLFAFFSSFFYLSWDLPIFSFRPLFHSVTHCQTTRPPSLGTPTTFS